VGYATGANRYTNKAVYYYEVFVADSRYRSDKPLTYSSAEKLPPMSVVTIPLQNRLVSGFILKKVQKPVFSTKPIRARFGIRPLPTHCLELARWLQSYYASSLGEALRQFAPSRPSIRQVQISQDISATRLAEPLKLVLESPLTTDQKKAIASIKHSSSASVLLHGDSGTGKTRVYLELARDNLKNGRSVLLLTPEIALSTQLAAAAARHLEHQVLVFHSGLGVAERKKIWLKILESAEPVVVIGPRSSLFAPIAKLGLIVLDEAHEPAYKQEQSPRYQTNRVASQLGSLTSAKVVFGTATPSVVDYYLAKERSAVIRMTRPALPTKQPAAKFQIIDSRERSNFSKHPNLSNQLLDEIKTTLLAKQQVLIYLNRRGSARLIMCRLCGWQWLCPNCDVPLVYHGDQHKVRCHTCGLQRDPPSACPQCANSDIIYKGVGTKALAEALGKLFPSYKLRRFDSDNDSAEQVQKLYPELMTGKINILVGTQLLAKGFDLPKLGLVGVIAAETSLFLPDYTAEERTFQLLYQVVGRVGRGHSAGRVVVQSYNPDSVVLNCAIRRDWPTYYNYILAQRRQFRFPPFAYLLKLTCRRATPPGAEKAAQQLKHQLAGRRLAVEIVGPAPSFQARRRGSYYWQLVLKSKQRALLVKLAAEVPPDWMVDLDPVDLL